MINELSHAGVKGMKWGVRKENYNSSIGRKRTGGSYASDNSNQPSVKAKKTRRGFKVVAKHDNTKVRVIISNSSAVAAGALRVAAAFIPGAGALSGAAQVAALAGTVANAVIK